jgi:hypothetical protein
MAREKERMSISIDPALADIGRRAVAEGRARSVSSWVSDALQLQVDHDARLQAIDQFIADYEAEHGEITEDEIAEVRRRDRASAIVVRGPGDVAS